MRYAANLHRLSTGFVVMYMLAALLLLYAGDYVVLRFRGDSTTSTVTIFDAAPLKDGRVSVFYDQPQTQTCVRSIFPWLGYEPCWYLKRHAIRIAS
jgi:hypothetical protein